MVTKQLKISRFLPAIIFIALFLTTLYAPIETVSADSINSGFNFFDDAYDVTPVADATYKEVDVSAYVPAGTSGVILDILNDQVSSGRSVWVRKKGSTDDYYGDIAPDGHTYAWVGVDENRIFEAKLEAIDLFIWLIGYCDSDDVVFFDDGADYSLGVTASYENIDASAVLPSGATGVIMFATSAVGNWDIRHPDSTDAVQGALVGADYIPSFGLCGVNTSREFEGYISSTSIDFYIIGYTKGDLITWKVNYTDVSLGVFDAWTDIDATASTTAGATGVITRMKGQTGNWLKGSTRIEGSTDDRTGMSRIRMNGWVFGACGLDDGEVFEGYADTLDVDHFVIGYCVEGEEEDERVFPDHVESSSGVNENVNNTLLDDDLWGNMTTTGWIMWDFVGTGVNITGIQWEICLGGGAGMFRMDVSNDKVDWTILSQMTAEEIYPPTGNATFRTRFDSVVSGGFRYLRIKPIKYVVNEWFIDFVALEVAPPNIVYEDETYFYPNYLKYISWKIYGMVPVDSNYAYRPHNMLGQNQTASDITEQSLNTSSRLVNQDYDPDNYVILRFADSMNISAIHTNFKQSSSTHSYIWISNSSDSGWELAYDFSGSAQGWRGTTFGTNRIMRYVKITSTGVGSSPLYIGATRVIGEIYIIGGNGVGNGEEDFSFVSLPSYIGDLLGIGLEGGQFLASLIVLSAFLFPIAVYDRKGIIALIVGVAVFGFLVLIGWLPQWLMLMMVLLVAGIFAFNFSKWFGGR